MTRHCGYQPIGECLVQEMISLDASSPLSRAEFVTMPSLLVLAPLGAPAGTVSSATADQQAERGRGRGSLWPGWLTRHT